VTVPSRLYYAVTPERPLAGVRFAVKDIVDIAGLRTGCGNRAWRQLYPIKTATAPAISQLLDAGAVLLGKTKSTQFAEGQAASEWFDYLCPFNPRGDGYQSASSSSTGSAASIAAYSWLDFTVGSDTGGSIRHPAGVNGSYGSRSSRGAISTKGVYAVTALFDTLGVFTREASMLHSVTKTMLSSECPHIQFPDRNNARYKLLYPVRGEGAAGAATYRWFPLPDEPGPAKLAEQEMERTVAKLEEYLNTKRSPFNIDDLWGKTRPEDQPASLDEATGSMYSTITTYTPVRAAIDPFVADYEAQFHRKPFIDPIVHKRQGIGRETSDAEYAKAVEAVEMFKSWVLDVLLSTKNNDKSEGDGDGDGEEVTPILIFPQAFGRPEYRDTHPEPSAAPLYASFSIYSISYVSGCPDYTIPVGEVPYESRIEGREAFLPVALSILSRPGTDAALSGLVEDLEKGGMLRPVRAGRRMYVEDR
ncbi:amidase signature enzyme, partial [Lophium mytilinum]